jgi:hypothetical protein
MDDLDAPARIFAFCTRLRALSGVSRVVVRVHSGALKVLEIAAQITSSVALAEIRGNTVATSLSDAIHLAGQVRVSLAAADLATACCA